MNKQDQRLDSSIEEMRSFYPQFSLSGLPIGTGALAVWKGVVQPIQSRSGLEYLLDDLARDRSVQVFPGGAVAHSDECGASHVEHQWMEEITNPYVSFRLKVQYGGGVRHPRAYVLQPNFPNLESRHQLGDGALCAYAPWEKVWLWDKHTVVDFMDHVVIWLIKSIVWVQAHIWIGSERSHDADYLLATIEPKAPCWCGSGKQYGDCHRLRNQMALFYHETAILKELDKRNPFSIRPLSKRSTRRSRRAISAQQLNRDRRSIPPASPDLAARTSVS
jgi:hypothetical protein